MLCPEAGPNESADSSRPAALIYGMLTALK